MKDEKVTYYSYLDADNTEVGCLVLPVPQLKFNKKVIRWLVRTPIGLYILRVLTYFFKRSIYCEIYAIIEIGTHLTGPYKLESHGIITTVGSLEDWELDFYPELPLEFAFTYTKKEVLIPKEGIIGFQAGVKALIISEREDLGAEELFRFASLINVINTKWDL